MSNHFTHHDISAENKAIPSEVKRVAAAGRLTYIKSFDFLIKAWIVFYGVIFEDSSCYNKLGRWRC